MELIDYLRDEIVEEANLGYISPDERDRRLKAFDNAYENAGQSNPGETPASYPGRYEDSDDSLFTSEIYIKSNPTDVRAYLAKPKHPGMLPGVLVIHENKGLTPHIEDVTRRLAREGFVAVAPDLLSRRGGSNAFSEPSQATAALSTIRGYELDEDLLAVISYLVENDSVQSDKLGAIGFCFGGGMVWRLATREPRLKAAVPFYGVNPAIKYVPQIQASVLAIYGELDERINAGIDEIVDAMEINYKIFEKIIYPGAQHGFHNDTNPDRYHPQGAQQAWQKTLDWLHRWLA